MSSSDFPLMHEVCEDVVDNAFESDELEDFNESESTKIIKTKNLIDSQEESYNEEMAKASLIFNAFFNQNP